MWIREEIYMIEKELITNEEWIDLMNLGCRDKDSNKAFKYLVEVGRIRGYIESDNDDVEEGDEYANIESEEWKQ